MLQYKEEGHLNWSEKSRGPCLRRCNLNQVSRVNTGAGHGGQEEELAGGSPHTRENCHTLLRTSL